MPLKERVERELRCVLTDEEVAHRADECAQKIAEIDAVESAKKSAMSEYKHELEALHGDVRTLSREVRERATTRTVECEVWIRPDGVETVRTDTGEVIGRRPLDPSEKQGSLFSLPQADQA